MKGWQAMRGPTGVGNRDLAEEGLGLVDVGFHKVLAQSRNFANLLEEQYLARSIAINAYAGVGVHTPWRMSVKGEMHRWCWAAVVVTGERQAAGRRWQWCSMAVGCV